MTPENKGHRGAHPADEKLFTGACVPMLRQAVYDLSWLLSRGYAAWASLKLVGDRYSLKERQRLAIARAACSDQQREDRQRNRLPLAAIRGQSLMIDGFNLIITVEAALSGGLLVQCRDDCIRDMSSVHGSYRSVTETEEAICLISETLLDAKPEDAVWLLDRPISNSGRLAQCIRGLAAEHQWPWSVEVLMNPDKIIRSTDRIAITSDSNILDDVARWVNLNELIVKERLSHTWVLDLNSN
jgi:hypothetical protein